MSTAEKNLISKIRMLSPEDFSSVGLYIDRLLYNKASIQVSVPKEQAATSPYASDSNGGVVYEVSSGDAFLSVLGETQESFTGVAEEIGVRNEDDVNELIRRCFA